MYVYVKMSANNGFVVVVVVVVIKACSKLWLGLARIFRNCVRLGIYIFLP